MESITVAFSVPTDEFCVWPEDDPMSNHKLINLQNLLTTLGVWHRGRVWPPERYYLKVIGTSDAISRIADEIGREPFLTAEMICDDCYERPAVERLRKVIKYKEAVADICSVCLQAGKAEKLLYRERLFLGRPYP